MSKNINLNGWIPTLWKYPQDKQFVLALDWTYDDILISVVQFIASNIAGQPEWKIISGAEIPKPEMWKEIELPDIVKNNFPNLFE